MSAALKIPARLINAQLKASDPSGSAWVSANAGSGKTYVLAQRVMRLLLNGIDPAKILCLTFTKVAAANMSLRVFKALAEWTGLDDAKLAEEINKTEGKRPDAQRLLRARRLFALALETPGGLKVQTIHAFCSAIMHQFPFEAGVAARFEVMEERAQDELINRVRLDVLLEAARTPGTPLARALAQALVSAADQTFIDVVREAVGQRSEYEAWLERAGSPAAAIAELDVLFGVGPTETVESVDAKLFNEGLPQSEWPEFFAILREGSTTDQAHIARLRQAMTLPGSNGVGFYLDVFCTAAREPRKNIVTKKIKDAHPAFAERLLNEQNRICSLLNHRRSVVARDRAATLAIITFEILTRYRNEKARRGVLDYDDLIEKTRALLGGSGSAWVMYKLDLGIDHVLIDEAQDTSEAQWDVIKLLTAEFFAGAGARSNVKRSIFAVGDEKQSIYSFQGADPQLFSDNRAHFEREHRAAKVQFSPVPLLHSFRSTIDVLGAVDEVFRQPHAHRGLAHDPVATQHEAVRTKSPGSVELWSLTEAAEGEKVEPWDAPFDAISEESPPVLLARRIARRVAAAIAGREPVEARDGAPLRPGDILILVRQRGPLFEAIIRALKGAGVDVAGADRLVLTDHIAIMDLMALADALLLRQDDLALAETLKNPLFGLDEEALFALAYGRRGSLRAALDAKRDEDPRFAAIADRLAVLEARARQEGPYAFYARLLGAEGGRKLIIGRLGGEANDALDEFLALAIDYERRHTPSLQGFVAWLRAANAEVKRDMDVVRDEVRVMTVHGAKGLEAPIVILADTTTVPRGPREPSLVLASRTAAAPMLWLGRKADDVTVSADARALAYLEAEHEHLRLLYVAMTRAEDKLIVCGYRGVNRTPAGCWYSLIDEALRPGLYAANVDDRDGQIWRWQKSPQTLPFSKQVAPPLPVVVAPPPGWLTQPLAQASGARERMSPSTAAPHVRRLRSPESEAAAAKAKARGTIVHRLLQSLPDVPEARREEAIRAYLTGRADILSAAEQDAVTAQIRAIMSHADFASLFTVGTRAEVPIVGKLRSAAGVELEVAGQIDRLAVTAESVLIADYKTDRNPGAVPKPYVVQLALYRALLARLFPDRRVRAAIVWTETAQLVEIPGPDLDVAAKNLGIIAA